MLDIRVVTIFYTIPLRHHTSPRVSAADKDDEASTRRKRPRARPPRKRFLFGTRRNKKPKSPRAPVYNVKRVHVPRTPFVRRRPPPRRRGVVSRHRATRRTMKFGQLFAATTASMAPNVREQVRDANARAPGTTRRRPRERRPRNGATGDGAVEYSQRATVAEGVGGRASRASRALKRDKNAREGCARGRREWGRFARDGGRRAREDGERRAARRANDSRALTD